MPVDDPEMEQLEFDRDIDEMVDEREAEVNSMKRVVYLNEIK
jgi:hypothetical protein